MEEYLHNKYGFRLHHLATTERTEKCLVVMVGWTGCTERNINNYVNLYLDSDVTGNLNCDVMVVFPTFLQNFAPFATRKLAINILDAILYLDTKYNSIIFQLFSGGYSSYIQCTDLMNTVEKYKEIKKKIIGVVCDSCPYSCSVTVASKSLLMYIYQLPGYKIIKIMRMVFLFGPIVLVYLLFYRSMALVHLLQKRLVIENHIPTLLLCCDTDVYVPIKHVQFVYDQYQKNGVICELHNFSKSMHVSHFLFYPKQYREILRLFLQKIKTNNNEASHGETSKL